MFEEFRHIRLQDINTVEHLISPDQAQDSIGLHSPAMSVMTDFKAVNPVTISESVNVDSALEWMKHQHVRMLFAVDTKGSFTGVITARDIMGRRVMAYMQANGLPREDVLVKHIMISKNNLQALTFDQLQHAKIGDVMLTFKDSGEQHILVVDEGMAKVKRVRGIISASDISRQLKVGFEVMYEAKSFAEIERIITHGGGI